MVGAPAKPTAVAVPVTNPARESDGREREGGKEGEAGKDELCNSCADK